MTLLDRVAGAPISWGISEVPGWGRVLPRDRVLAEMQGLGLRATELGPAGFLPPEPADLTATLDAHGLRLVAGFVPAVLHRADQVDQALAAVGTEAARLHRAGAEVLVLAAATGDEGYEQRPVLDDDGWRQLVESLARTREQVGAVELALTVHPHVGTMIEGRGEVERLLEVTDVSLCVDTGHLAIGGTDPVVLAQAVPDRIGHVHLKDVDLDRAAAVRDGRLSYLDAVRQGLYRPLGRGDVDVAAVIAALEGAGYQGWYVLEQDVSLPADPRRAAEPAAAGATDAGGETRGAAGTDPAADVRTSLELVREVERQIGTAADPHAGETTTRAPT